MEATSYVTSAGDCDDGGEHPLRMVMMMVMLPPMLILMALSFHCDHAHVHFLLARATKSNRDNCAGGLVDKSYLTGNQ